MRDLFIMGYTSAQVGEMTIYDAVNLIDGYVFKYRQMQNLLAEFVTLPVVNTAGKIVKKNLTLNDLFPDGRFNGAGRMSKSEVDYWRRTLRGGESSGKQ